MSCEDTKSPLSVGPKSEITNPTNSWRDSVCRYSWLTSAILMGFATGTLTFKLASDYLEIKRLPEIYTPRGTDIVIIRYLGDDGIRSFGMGCPEIGQDPQHYAARLRSFLDRTTESLPEASLTTRQELERTVYNKDGLKGICHLP